MNTPPSYIAVYIISVKLTGLLGHIVDLNDVFSHWKIWLHSRRPRLENEPGEGAEVVEDRFIHLQKIDEGLVELQPDLNWDPHEKEFVREHQRYLFLGVSRQNLNQILQTARNLELRFGEYNILENNCHDFVRALSKHIMVEPQRVGDALNEPRRSLEYTFGADSVKNIKIATRMLRIWLWPMLKPMARGAKRTGSGGTVGQVMAAGVMDKEAGKEGEPAGKTLRDLFLEIQKQLEGEGEGEPTTEITT
jgi:hypothetical protein